MKYTLLENVLLMCLWPSLALAQNLSESAPQIANTVYESEDASLRFHGQWIVDEGTRTKLQKTYGTTRVRFDPKGSPLPHGLSQSQIKRWERLYRLCMSDGCYYCDAGEGSCELGTCGTNNRDCRPYLAGDGQPLCGRECADYAFKSMLTCNDPS